MLAQKKKYLWNKLHEELNYLLSLTLLISLRDKKQTLISLFN